MKKFLSPRAAVEFLAENGIKHTEGTLATWRSKKTGPGYIKVKTRVYYTLEDLAAYFAGVQIITLDQTFSNCKQQRLLEIR